MLKTNYQNMSKWKTLEDYRLFRDTLNHKSHYLLSYRKHFYKTLFELSQSLF